MSDNGDLREDLKIPEAEIGQQLKNEYDAGKELLVSRLSLCMCIVYKLIVIYLLFIKII